MNVNSNPSILERKIISLLSTCRTKNSSNTGNDNASSSSSTTEIHLQKEIHLSASLLLTQTTPSIVRNIISQNCSLLDFVHGLLKVQVDSDNIMKDTTDNNDCSYRTIIANDAAKAYHRLGIRILQLYYDYDSFDDDTNNIDPTTGYHFNLIKDLFIHYHNQLNFDKSNIMVIHFESIEAISLILRYQMTKHDTSCNDSSKWMNDNETQTFIWKLPQMVWQLYNMLNNEQQKDPQLASVSTSEMPITDDESSNKTLYETMFNIITSTLDNNKSNSNCKDELKNRTNQINLIIEFFMVHSQYIQYYNINTYGSTLSPSSSSKNKNDTKNNLQEVVPYSSILSKSMLVDMIQYITNRNHNSTTTEATIINNRDDDSCLETTRLIIHMILLSYIQLDLTNYKKHGLSSSTSSTPWSMIQSLSINHKNKHSQQQKEDIDYELPKLMHRLIIFGISSSLDYNYLPTQSAFLSSSSSQPLSTIKTLKNAINQNKIINDIRTMTLNIYATLMEECNHDWIFLPPYFNKGNIINIQEYENESTLGVASVFCMILRLVAGDFRIIMGELIDYDYLREKDGAFPNSLEENDQQSNNILLSERIGHCIRIGLYILNVLVNLDDGEKTTTYPLFNVDAILHIKHSLEDMLDVVTQFLIETVGHDDSNDKISNNTEWWEHAASLCCKYLGAYLSQVNIFDFDDNSNKIKEDEVGDNKDDPDMERTFSSSRLLMTVRNALILCERIDQYNQSVNVAEDKKVVSDEKRVDCKSSSNATKATSYRSITNAITLFPSIVAIFSTCCDEIVDESIGNKANAYHVKLIKKYLLKDNYNHSNHGVLIKTICSTMDRSLALYEENRIGLEDNEEDGGICDGVIKILTWCNMVIESLFEFFVNTTTALHSRVLSKEDDECVQIVYKSTSCWMQYLLTNPYDDVLKGTCTNLMVGMMRSLLLIHQHVKGDTLQMINSDNEVLMSQRGF